MFERPSAHRNALGAIGCAMALLVVAAGAGPAAAIAAPAEATAAAVVRDGSPRVRAELLVHPDDAAPFGPVRVGVLLRMSPGWHVYGPEPGDSGLPTLLRWEVDGGEVGAVAWPPVETFSEADGRFKTYGFSGEVLLAAPLTVLRTDPPVALVGVSVELLACKIECVPARFSLRRALDETGSTADADETRRLFVRYAPQLAGSRPPRRPGCRSAWRPRSVSPSSAGSSST
ncbi:MAG: protein-disulfide reductase DsbD domain-containing protein [Myxococcota bacterium]